MQIYNIESLKEKYDLELDKIIKTIQQQKPKTVLLQFPDGLKPYATAIVDYLETKTNSEFRISLGSCFGACDIPKTDSDLIIQFGHAAWN